MRATKQPTAPAFWHPNFRDPKTLPDTKVIRTSFAINAAAVAVVLGLVGFLYTREAATAALRGEIADWNAKIEANQPRLKKASELQKEFSAAEKKVREIEAFLAPKLVASEFLATVAETLPRLIKLDSIEMGSLAIRLRGSVAGSSERSAPLAKAYADQLAARADLQAVMESIKLNSQSRDQANDRFTFEIELKFKPASTAPKAAPKPPQPTNDE